MAGGDGGRREGAGRKANPEPTRNVGGRPRKPRTPEEKNQAFDQKAIAALPELFDTIKAIAMGYKIAVYEKPRKIKATEMYDEEGEPIWVYQTPPDKAATMYLVDRAAGRAAVKHPESVETELILEVSMGDDNGDEENK